MVEFTDSKGAVSSFSSSIEFNLPKNEANDLGPPTFKEALNDAYVFLGKNSKIKLPAVDSSRPLINERVDLGEA